MTASSVKLDFNVDAAVQKIGGNVVRGVRAATAQADAEIAVMYSHPGTGRFYGNHQASAPGEPPAPDTGMLRARRFQDVAIVGNEVVGRVVVNSAQAAALELGTDRIAPRPALRRAVVEGWNRIMKAFKAAY